MEKEKARMKSITRAIDLHKVRIEAVSHIGARTSQQDAFGISDYRNETFVEERGILAVLSDGMGGLSNGTEASITSVGVCQEYFKSVTVAGTPWQELLSMAAQANRNVLRDRASDGAPAGATLLLAHIHREGLYFLSVGDSKIFLLRAGGLVLLNRPHVYARTLDLEEAAGKKEASETRMHPERASLTSYIGKEGLEAADFNMEPLKLLRGDLLLLMSDGVFNTLTEEEIVTALSASNLAHGMGEMQRMILEKQKPSQDNFTALCMKF